MNNLKWEYFEEFVTNKFFSITDNGPLHGPITRFSIIRDANLKLTLETTSTGYSTSREDLLPAGSVYIATEQIKLESKFGSSAVARGVIPISHNSTWSRELPTGETRETSSVHTLEWYAQQLHEPSYTIEWLENMPGSFIWPNFMDKKTTGETRFTFRSQKKEIIITSPINSNGGSSRSCVHISVDGIDLFIGTLKNNKIENIRNPGFILYVGNHTEDIRSKIRDCLSFSFGTYLAYLGHTSFDDQWETVSFKAITAEAFNADDHRLNIMPPAPLGSKYEWEVTPDILEKIVTSLYHNYDDYNLKSAFWAYWHAIAAPVHMAAIHFAAAIEALKKAYVQRHHTLIKTSILDNTDWKNFHKKLETCIESLDISNLHKKLLSNKVSNLNSKPQDIVMEHFLDALKIKIDVIEQSAWKNRNHAAHGGSVHEDNAIKIIRENKALMVLMNRILLAITAGNDLYYDYYTLGRPTSRLADPIPNDNTV